MSRFYCLVHALLVVFCFSFYDIQYKDYDYLCDYNGCGCGYDYDMDVIMIIVVVMVVVMVMIMILM